MHWFRKLLSEETSHSSHIPLVKLQDRGRCPPTGLEADRVWGLELLQPFCIHQGEHIWEWNWSGRRNEREGKRDSNSIIGSESSLGEARCSPTLWSLNLKPSIYLKLVRVGFSVTCNQMSSSCLEHFKIYLAFFRTWDWRRWRVHWCRKTSSQAGPVE